MHTLKSLLRIAVVMCAFITAIQANAVKVYLNAKNASEAWSDVKAYVYDDTKNPVVLNAEWPGKSMYYNSASGYWEYDIPSPLSDNCRVIFSSNGNSPRYPAAQQPGLEFNGAEMIYDVGQGLWTKKETNQEPETTLTDYTIYFHNRNTWENVYVTITGNSAFPGGEMTSNLNSDKFKITFKGPSSGTMTCSFYTLTGGSEANRTGYFTVVDGHIYTISGDKGPESGYDASDWPEAEYWFEPASPTQNDKVILYFNKAYDPNSKLKNTSDIYLHTGVIKKGDGDAAWTGGPSAWNYSESDKSKYKMTLVDGETDIYKYEYAPTVYDWAGLSADSRISKIAFIFRNLEGAKQHEADQFFTLRQLPDPQLGLGAYQSHELNDGTLAVTGENGVLNITPYSNDVIKIFPVRNGTTKGERRSISVIAPDDPLFALDKPEDVSVSDAEDKLVLSVGGEEKLSVDKTNCTITYLDSEGNAKLTELNGLVNIAGDITVSFQPNGGAESFYGGGYYGDRVDQNGKTLVMENRQTGGWYSGDREDSHNISIPFIVSTNNYGIYFDDHYDKAKIYPSATNGTTYKSGSLNPIAYYYVGGETMQEVVENYTRLTGLQELPPMWALGYITSKYSFKSRLEAEQVIKKTKNESSLPLDGIVFDIHWQGGRGEGSGFNPNKMGKIDWDTANYPNPQEMMAKFRSQNVHTIAITEPYFTEESGNYNTLNDNGWFADSDVSNMSWLGSKCGLIDVSNTGACEWYKDLYKKRTREGIESWWLDLGEPERHDPETSFSDGSNDAQMHNEYGNLWCKLAYEAMKELESESTNPVRRILMPRAGTSGMQRYNVYPWTGDIKRSWGGLAAQVPALVTASMSGVSNLGSDIGGFSEPSGYNEKIYLRWVQLGVFYPSMRTHAQGWLSPGPEPYNFPSVLGDVRRAMNLRYAYLPYTYTRSYLYTRFGTPIARPANFGDAVKERLSNSIDTYLWGPDIFVAPVLSDVTTRSITFPEGAWLDMNDFKTVYEGQRTINYSAPLSVLPHFMREGSFVPRYTQDKFTSTAEIESHRLTVDYFPSFNNSERYDDGYFYDDDHISVKTLADKAYMLTGFHAKGDLTAGGKSLTMWISRQGEGWSDMYGGKKQDIMLRVRHCGDLVSVIGENNIEVIIRDMGAKVIFPDQQGSTMYCGRRMPERAPRASFPAMTKVASLTDLQASTVDAYYFDGTDMHIHLPKIDPKHDYEMSVAGEGIYTGIEETNILEAMTLAYGDGYVTYSAPEGTESLTLGVYSATGIEAAHYENLETVGYARQIELALPQGVYILRLTGRAVSGETRTRTVKAVVK